MGFKSQILPATMWFVLLATLAFGFDMDPVGDPVLQRLDIPAQIHSQSQDMPDVTIEAGKPFIINLPSAKSEVNGRDGKPLPPWIVYDATNRMVRGQPSETDTGDWSVSLEKDIFTIRVRRQLDEEDDYGSGDYDDEDLPVNQILPTIPTPIVNAPTPVLRAMPSASTKLVIQPTKIALDLEPTPVLIDGTTLLAMEDFTNSSLFEPVEPTATLDLNGHNTIDEDDEKKLPLPPQVTMHLPRIVATAGKVFRFTIPDETFSDVVDGKTSNLRLELLPQDGDHLWLAFNSTNNEIYGLPLADDIGKYKFTIRARNSANLTVTEASEIQVRQHQSERAFHHKFVLQLEPEFSTQEEELPQVYWMLKTVSALSKTFGDKEDAVVVRNVNGTVRNGNAFTFTWSNETMPRTHCPEDEITELFEKIYNRETDYVADQLDQELSPQLQVTYGNFELNGICQPAPTTPSSAVDMKPMGRVNSPPVVTNQVDYIEAQVGVVFRYQVPIDTFHDEEDGDTRMLKLMLLNMSHQAINPKSWLQFDALNQEFYGLPLDSDIGTEEYQLVCTDQSGATASDGLVVAVKERSKKVEDQPLVEFSLQIDDDYDSLMTKADRKVRLVEAIAKLFNDTKPENVIVRSITSGSTVITWNNRTISGTSCPPSQEIVNLRRILIEDDKKLTQRCKDVLSAEAFEPISADVSPLGNCLGQLTPTYGPELEEEKTAESDPNDAWTDDYLLTFIVPGIIITVMLLLAAVIACVLYRRRRTGKLGLEERRSFVSKGIPIIFAEELEERPSGRQPAKAPVILKEEKPSQPPDYHKVRSEHQDLLRSPSDEEEPAGLYQPPPPLSTSRESSRYSRPKATPAYRKPPPYVPP